MEVGSAFYGRIEPIILMESGQFPEGAISSQGCEPDQLQCQLPHQYQTVSYYYVAKLPLIDTMRDPLLKTSSRSFRNPSARSPLYHMLGSFQIEASRPLEGAHAVIPHCVLKPSPLATLKSEFGPKGSFLLVTKSSGPERTAQRAPMPHYRTVS